MISKRIACHPANDSYARLANYITGHDHTREQKNVRTYTPQYHPGELGNLAENRLRRLSELGLAHRQGREGEKRSGTSLLSVDARPDRQAPVGLRRDADCAAGEKCLLTWASGCWAGDDYELGIREVADTQALNTRTTKEKTYHLIVSFRPEDASRLTPDDYRAIEERFTAALGLARHQRHCGVHITRKADPRGAVAGLCRPRQAVSRAGKRIWPCGGQRTGKAAGKNSGQRGGHRGGAQRPAVL